MPRSKTPAEGAHPPSASVQEIGDFLSSGSVLMDLALSDDRGGWSLGTMVNLIGDSSSGKTVVALTTLANAAHDERFEGHRIVYDDVEAACQFDLEYLFGEEAAARIEAPDYDEDEMPIMSNTIQDWRVNVKKAVSDGPCVYVLDSFDALTSREEEERTAEEVKGKGDGADGSYKTEKAKIGGEILRQVVRHIERTGSLLIIVSQTRQKVGGVVFGSTKYRSGGRALQFYATHEIWLSVKGKKKSRERVVGTVCKGRVSKNKVTGKVRDFEFPIYYDLGIDDVASSVDFLVTEKAFRGNASSLSGKVGREEFERKNRAKLIEWVEESDKRMHALRNLTVKTWMDVEDSLRMQTRRRRFP